MRDRHSLSLSIRLHDGELFVFQVIPREGHPDERIRIHGLVQRPALNELCAEHLNVKH